MTGGTGFLGRHVVRGLVAAGHEVRVLARSPDVELAADGVETMAGSVLAPADLATAFAGCAAVYHLAGRVDRERRPGPALRELHVDGTRNVVEAAAEAGVARVVYASTSGTIAVSRAAWELPREDAPAPTALTRRWPYYATKLEAEEVALERARSLGVPLVCLNPSLLLGPGDLRRSSIGAVADVVDGRLPLMPTGGLNFVDVRDAAAAAVNALERGRPGERYLVGGHNWTLERFVRFVALLGGVEPPRLVAPSRITRWATRAAELVATPLGLRLPVDPVSVEMSQAFWYFDSSKAHDELGLSVRPADETLRDTIAWLGAA